MKLSLTTILIFAVVLLGIGFTVLLVIVLKKPQKTEQMIRNEVLLEVSERDRLKDSVAWSKRELWYDSTLSATTNRIQELEDKKAPIYYAIKNTPTIVSNYDREQLRRSFTTGE